ncbi:MAG TPA: AAA family ATPase [Solirubrobacterales bacterium]|nr:AAA family ATPase [Solirubrobacterales bacterium]
MNDGQLRRLLTDRSVWWRDSGWERDDPDLREATESPFRYEPDPLSGLDPEGLYVLRGPRRVGKSVELKRAIATTIRGGANPRLVFFCSCDGLSAQDIRRLIAVGQKDTATLSGDRHWFLDEITAVPGWAVAIKELRDGDPVFRRSCVVLSGSSARDLRDATKALAGRRGGVSDSDRLLLPMDFRSFCLSTGGFEGLPEVVLRPRDLLSAPGERAIAALSPFFSDLDHAWQSYLRVGGFPRAVADFVATAAVSEGFAQALWDVIAGDAFQSTGMTDMDVATFVERLVIGIGSPLNASAVARDVGLSDNHRVDDRIGALGFALMAWRCHQIKGELPNLRAQEKVYFLDPLIARLPHMRDERRRDPDDSQMTEQQLGVLLLRAAADKGPQALLEANTVMYERTASEAEIDFAGPELGAAFEGKYVDGPWRRAAQTMRARHERGVMVTRTVLDLDDRGGGARVWAVPAGIVGWLLRSPASQS